MLWVASLASFCVEFSSEMVISIFREELGNGRGSSVGLDAFYGAYYGLSHGSAKAMIADLVPEALHGTAYGTYGAAVGILDVPASVIAGVLWQGVGPWSGFGVPPPFLFGGALALLAALLMAFWVPRVASRP